MMKLVKLISKVLLAVFVGGAGVMHFGNPDFFLRIVPPYLPWHMAIVLVSGAIEIALAVGLLIPATSRWAAWGMIALFIAVFPANIYLFQNQHLMPDVSPTAQLIRLPMQLVLILWAFWYTRPEGGGAEKTAAATAG